MNILQKILYPTDFSASAVAALNYVKGLKGSGVKEVIIVHIYDEAKIDAYWEVKSAIETKPVSQIRHDIIKDMLDSTYKKLKKIECKLTDMGLKAELIVETGIPYKRIIKIAKDSKANLIVMGSHGERGFWERMIGSTTERVVRESPIPVLVVKPKG